MPETFPKLIRVGHSPDPDDAFMFYALAHKKIDMHGFKVEHVIKDIESLNQRALAKLPSFVKRGQGRFSSKIPLYPPLQKGEDPLEVTAVSCHAYAYLADKYVVMRSGASVGDGYGPILVQRATLHKALAGRARNTQRNEKNINIDRCPLTVARKRIALPGKLTTAYLVLQLYTLTVDHCALCGFDPVFVTFDKIFDAVRSGEVDYGLIIHEGQITYKKHGLELAVDLGKWWHEKTQLPLPLGVDVIRRDLGEETMKSFARLFKESIEYALRHRKEALEYASRFGRGISDDLNDRFVAMYVNDRTVDIGADGEAGFRRLLDEAYQHGIIPKKIELEFI